MFDSTPPLFQAPPRHPLPPGQVLPLRALLAPLAHHLLRARLGLQRAPRLPRPRLPDGVLVLRGDRGDILHPQAHQDGDGT